MEIKLADALLRRKQLQKKVDQLEMIKDKDFFETRVQRKQISDTIDDIIAQVPKLTLSEFTAEFDYYAKRLRIIDSIIQQKNWVVKVNVEKTIMEDYSESLK